MLSLLQRFTTPAIPCSSSFFRRSRVKRGMTGLLRYGIFLDCFTTSRFAITCTVRCFDFAPLFLIFKTPQFPHFIFPRNRAVINPFLPVNSININFSINNSLQRTAQIISIIFDKFTHPFRNQFFSATNIGRHDIIIKTESFPNHNAVGFVNSRMHKHF